MARYCAMIYLDHLASTPLDPQVLEAMLPWMRIEAAGNPHAAHPAGWRAADAIEQARGEVAALAGAQPGEVVFTSGATEANTLALLGGVPAGGGCVVSAVEHASILGCLPELRRRGHPVAVLPVDGNGRRPGRSAETVPGLGDGREQRGRDGPTSRRTGRGRRTPWRDAAQRRRAGAGHAYARHGGARAAWPQPVGTQALWADGHRRADRPPALPAGAGLGRRRAAARFAGGHAADAALRRAGRRLPAGAGKTRGRRPPHRRAARPALAAPAGPGARPPPQRGGGRAGRLPERHHSRHRCRRPAAGSAGACRRHRIRLPQRGWRAVACPAGARPVGGGRPCQPALRAGPRHHGRGGGRGGGPAGGRADSLIAQNTRRAPTLTTAPIDSAPVSMLVSATTCQRGVMR
ncbi:hypothetical protein Lal_00013811 [Lupinus albus]|nr:hypothetical protein Lal_00013811 [Lupinus albus]